ncbi:MAG TPA: hypothetical protein ACFYED_03175 [Candidatus Tripitaka californicus]|uniref:hypothetical protein n=1 Tax=Candidatus Tripitaka californicus TaxID=3367616 RepID=UPI0040267704|nr:hypothetical protein [Planctomycetota bacterium]
MIDYKELVLTLVYAFDRVRKYGIVNDLTLEEELIEYLTTEELSEVMTLLENDNALKRTDSSN